MSREGEEILMVRESFYKTIDILLKDAPEDVRQFFKDFVEDPETTTGEMQELVDRMLDSLNVKDIAQC